MNPYQYPEETRALHCQREEIFRHLSRLNSFKPIALSIDKNGVVRPLVTDIEIPPLVAELLAKINAQIVKVEAEIAERRRNKSDRDR